jgi:hypothetical protein
MKPTGSFRQRPSAWKTNSHKNAGIREAMKSSLPGCPFVQHQAL